MEHPDTNPRRSVAWALVPSRDDALFVVGASLVFAGLWMIGRPVALIVLGLLLVLLAFRA